MAGATGETSWVQWSAEVFTDIQKGNVKELDTDRFFSLDRPISKRLYRYLDRYLAESPRLEADLLTLAAQLGIIGTTHIGKIKERLKPAIEELEAFGDFIVPATREQRYTKTGPRRWIIHFQKPNADAIKPVSRPKSQPTRSRQPTNTIAEKLVVDFYTAWKGDNLHRVTKHEAFQASEVIQRYGAEKAQELLPLMIRQLKKGWPEAKLFGATMNYWHDADKAKQRKEKSAAVTSFLPTEDATEKSAEQARIDRLREQWSKLTESQKQIIRHRLSQTGEATVRRFLSQEKYTDPLVELACLDELERNPVSE